MYGPAYDALRQRARMTPAARAAAERAELTEAARSVAKVWLLRHQVQRVPLPPDFLTHHPEVRRETAFSDSRIDSVPEESDRQRAKHWADYPNRGSVLNPQQVTEQHRSYWCGPTAMQMIAWGWKGADRGQDHWASKLGTTTSGTSIYDMVRVTNGNTGWDLPSHAGKYVVLDVGGFTFQEWLLLNMKHVVDFTAPMIYHPILLKQFYPYLDDDASGHYQVGRGYLEQEGKPTEVSYFEPWNQQLFDPSEPFIKRVQWRDAYKSYRANLAHPMQNIGV